ncbi:cytochrome c oxidase assembly factor 7 homolog [Polistes fuscatus]|uniref:cytochrome c oxidase assembly factor 7 homolog n=1 Tax=Polistes fuscatus TaxID=30207 RepID=UPI001CA85B30|nr:cytochrome c oxidase assembly factor 7 homolog [Polistes fuscatus]
MSLSYNLKKPEEVKEYLKNLHIEYKFGCYSEKNPEVCHLLGDFNEAIKKDFKKAGELYKANCDERNYPRSCTKYGEYLIIGRGFKRDINEAYKYLVKACDLNNDSGCLHSGILAITDEFDDNRSEQINKGICRLKKACHDLNSEKACYFLSGLYLKGIKDYVKPNIKEAYKLSVKSCEFGNPYACANVSQMYLRGDGVEKDANLAKLFQQRADQIERELKHSKPLQFQEGIQVE